MTIELQNVQRLRVYQETSANFGTDLSANIASFVDVPFIEGSATAAMPQETLNPEHAQQHIDALPVFILGQKSWTFGFTMNLAPTGVAAGDGTAQVQGPLGLLLETVFGGEKLATGSAATGTPTTILLPLAHLVTNVGIEPGAAIGWETSAGVLHARELKTASGVNTAPKLAFPSAPALDDAVYGAASYYLAQNPTGSLQFALEGLEQDDRWLLMGGQLDSISFSIQLGQIPRVTFNFKGVHWLHGADTATTLTGSALGTASYTNVEPIAVTGGRFDFVDTGVTTLPTAGLCVNSVNLNLNLSYTEIPCANGPGNVKRWKRVRSAPVITYSFTTFYEDADYWDDWADRTAKALFMQIGQTAGDTLLLSVPASQITNVQPADHEGMAGQMVEGQGRLDSDTSGSTTDLAKSAFRIHLL